MDIENVIGLAPSATIDVYQAPGTLNEDVLAVYSAIVNNDADPVGSTSWGECEPGEDATDSLLPHLGTGPLRTGCRSGPKRLRRSRRHRLG